MTSELQNAAKQAEIEDAVEITRKQEKLDDIIEEAKEDEIKHLEHERVVKLDELRQNAKQRLLILSDLEKLDFQIKTAIDNVGHRKRRESNRRNELNFMNWYDEKKNLPKY